MDQIYTGDMDGASFEPIKLSDGEADRIVPVGRSRRKDTLLGSFELWWLDFALFVVVVIQANVEDEDDPDVAEAIKTFEAARIDLIHKCQPSTSLLHKATLAWCAKLLPKT